MTNKIKLALYVGVAAAAVFGGVYLLTDRSSPPATAANQSTSAGAEQGEDHDEGGPIKMTASERAARGIATARVGMRILSDEVVVPGEVMLDLYRSAQVTPRISAQVVARHVKLGDQVKAGQRLVTLSSVEMADAQGALVVATREWQRVRELGRDIVSERRYVEAQVTAEQARAKVLAFGLTPDQATALVKTNDASKATGTFDLLTAQDGTVASDKFVVGEIVAPGRVLFQITDERRVWVEAQLTAAQAGDAKVGAQVRVLVDGDHEFGGHIVQAYHMLNETTRTLPIRVEVNNADDALHPGQFVNVAVEVGSGQQTLAVPESAITLMDGNATVFMVEGNELHPTAIDIGEKRASWVEVKAGLAEGDEIATTQVFLLKSLIQKSKMGEGH